MSIASLVLGIIAILTCLIPIIGAVIALIALIIAIVAMCKKNVDSTGKGLRITGLILSILAMLGSLVITVPIVAGAAIISENNEKIIEEAQNAVSAAELANARNACLIAYAEASSRNSQFNDELEAKAYNEYGNIMTAEDYYKAVAEEEEETVAEIKSKYVITVNETGTPISVEAKK